MSRWIVASFGFLSLLALSVVIARFALSQGEGPISAADTESTSLSDLGSGKPPAELPRVELPETEHDFGAVELNAEVVHRFKVRNVGNAPLTLRLGESTCRCTTGDVPEEPIAPGDESEISVRFLEERHFGPFRQYAEIHTNDPRQPRFTFTISGIVKAELACDPERMDFSGAVPGLPTARSMTIYSQTWREFYLELERVEPAGVECEISPAAEEVLRQLDAVSGYRIDVRIPGELAHANLAGEIQFRVVSPVAEIPRTLTIPLAAVYPARIEIDSPYLGGGRVLDFGRIPQGKRAAVELPVRTRELRRPLAIKEAEVDPEQLRVSLLPDPAVEGNYRLTIEVPGDSPQFVRLRGRPAKVKVIFDDPLETAFEFLIFAAVVDPEISLPR